MNLKARIALILAVLFASAAFSLDKNNLILKDVLKDFKRGYYSNAQEKIQALKKDKKLKSTAYYLSGVMHMKEQEYEDAISNLKIAIRLKNKSEDLFYEYAQAHYAMDNLKTARRMFGKSVSKRFKVGMSLYYIAYISQLKKDTPLAIKYYKKISKLPSEMKKDVDQAANYQLAEIYHDQSLKHPNPSKMMVNFAIPQYEKAHRVDRSGSLAPDIKKKVYKLKEKYGLITTKFRNGRPVPRKKWSFTLTTDLTHDNNNISEADEATTPVADTSANIFTLAGFYRYRFLVKDLGMITPEVKYKMTKFLDRDNATFYSKDNNDLDINVRTQWEHTLFGKYASALFDVEYSYKTQDNNSLKEQEYNSKGFTFSAGERFRYFKAGSTTLKLKRAHNYSYADAADSITTTFSLTQLIRMPTTHTLVLINNYTFTRNDNETLDTNAYSLIGSYVIGKLGWFDLPTFGLTTTMTDTKQQSTTRGTEFLLSPSFRISKVVKRKLKFTWKIDYTKQISDDKANYAYNNWTTAFETAYNF